MTTWRDKCELRQQELNLAFKDYSSKSMSKIRLMTDFVKENSWLIREPVCNSKLFFLGLRSTCVSLTRLSRRRLGES